MTDIVVLNSKTGADFTCIDCGVHVCAAVHHGEPVCLECNFLRQIPAEHRDQARRRLFPNRPQNRARS